MNSERKTIWLLVERLTLLSLLGVALASSLLCLSVLAQTPNQAPTVEQKTGSPQKRILLLYSQRRDGPYSATFDRVLQQTLNQGMEGRIDSYQEYIDEQRFFDQKYRVALRDFIRSKHGDQRYDLVVAIGGAAISFAVDYGPELFPETPVVFYGGEGRARPNFTGVTRWRDLRSTIEVALRLQPNTKNVFVISGSSERDLEIESIARKQLQALEDRAAFTYVTGLPMDELLQKVANLPPDSVIYYLEETRDRTGAKYFFPDAMSKVCAAANAPVYGPTDWHLDNGAIGGSVLDTETLARQTAEIALRVLRGEKAEDIPLAAPPPNINMFDWRKLKQWGISEARLPPGSIVRFKELTLWEQYKGRIIAVSAILVLQTLLLAGLLLERSRKRRGARRLAESEERFAKAFKANPQPMSVTTVAEGRYLDVNESFLRMSGYTRAEVIGHTANELGNYENPADRDTLLIEPLLQSGVVRNFELKFRTKSSVLRTLLSSAELLELAGEQCILVASSDITERKTLEQELQRSEREFSTLVENSPDIIARLDPDLRYIYISPVLERATGVSTDRFIGKTALEVALDGYNSQSFEATCREAISTKKATSRAFDFGGRHYWTRVVPEFAPDGAVESVMTISEDVTDRIRAQEELLQLTGQLFRSQDEERRRIARELHDGTAQNLFGISMNLAKLSQMNHDKPEARRLINECETLGNESLQEIRTLSYLLHPPLLDEAGLVSALQWYVEGFTKRSGIYVDLVAQPMNRLPADVELALFRIVQESLTNVRHHSGSETASIRLEKRSSEIVLEIQDKGHGLVASKQASDANESEEFIEMGVGIPGMQQRLRQLGGRLEITTNTEGTTITAVVPVANGANHVANPSRGRS